jgi:hypothetical protein
MKTQTKRNCTRRNKTKRNCTRRNKTKRNYTRRNKTKRNLREFIPGNQGQGHILFSIPEKQKSLKIIVDNNHKQFGNIIPGLREM